jgi:hypothetical protein
MGLTFKKDRVSNTKLSSVSASEGLTSENIQFLEEIGFKVVNNGYSGYSARTDVRRDLMGKGVSHSQPLRFIEIKQ